MPYSDTSNEYIQHTTLDFIVQIVKLFVNEPHN